MFGGVMFKTTAKICKEWADIANNTTYDSLLVDIAIAAKAGRYMLNVKTLSEEFKVKLTNAGFTVSKNPSHSGKHDSYLIMWA